MERERGYWRGDATHSCNAVRYCDGTDWFDFRNRRPINERFDPIERMFPESEIAELVKEMHEYLDKAYADCEPLTLARISISMVQGLLDRLSPPLEIECGKWYADKHQNYPWSYVLCKKHDDWLCLMVSITDEAYVLCVRASDWLTRRATPAEVAALRAIVPLGE